MLVKKQQLELDMEQWTGSNLKKENIKAVYCQTCLFNLYAQHIMRNAGLHEHKLESRLLGEISITSDMQMTQHLRQKMKRN